MRRVAVERDRPGIVGRRRTQPGDAIRAIKPTHQRVAGARVVEGGVALAMEKDRAVAGVFRHQIHLAGQQRRPHQRGRAEPGAVGNLDAVRPQHVDDHRAEDASLGVQLG